MNDSKYTKVRAAFRRQMAELTVGEIGEWARHLRLLLFCDKSQIAGLLADMDLMLDYKSKQHSTAEAWASIERGFKKS